MKPGGGAPGVNYSFINSARNGGGDGRSLSIGCQGPRKSRSATWLRWLVVLLRLAVVRGVSVTTAIGAVAVNVEE